MHALSKAAVGLVGLLAVAMAGQATAADDRSTLDTIVERGSMRVGVGAFVPWAFRNKEGQYVGFEVDVAAKLARDIGVELDLVPTAWDGIIPALLAGKFDVIIGGMTVTAQRNLKINFTDSYQTELGQDVVANKAKVPAGADIEALNNPRYSIGVRRGAVSVEAARKHFPLATLRQYDDEAIIQQEVLAGNVDMWVTSAPKPAFLAADHPDQVFLPLTEKLSRSNVGFGLRKGDFDTMNFFNNWIAINKEEGFLQERADYWFGSRAWKDEVAE